VVVPDDDTDSEGASVDLRNTVVARLVQCLIALLIMAMVGLNGAIILAPEAPDKAMPSLCFLVGLSTVLVVITIEFVATRIITAIQAHPQAFAAEIKSQRSTSTAIKTAS
jgi:hypothetical protein